MKDCLISFSSKGREDYNAWLLKMLDSAIDHWHGDYLIYSPDHELNEYKGIKINHEMPAGFIPHSEMPYQFKFKLIEHARSMGYDRVVWLDTSIRINKNLTPLFQDEGVTVFHNLGHDLYKYISDDAVSLLGVSENELKNIPQIWGGALLFDFTKWNCKQVFGDIYEFSLNGSFKNGTSSREGFIGHRHDQAVMSVLTYKRCDLMPYGKIVCKQHADNLEYGNDIYLIYE